MKKNTDRCGIGRCKNESDGTVWAVPICSAHWTTCAEATPDRSSVEWLRKHAREEWQSELPDAVDPPVAKPPVRRVANPLRAVVRRRANPTT